MFECDIFLCVICLAGLFTLFNFPHYVPRISRSKPCPALPYPALPTMQRLRVNSKQ